MINKINLVKNGIFPIIFDKDGNAINETLDTGFSTPGTIQGEGKLIGTTCLFVRTSGCNLRCVFMDNNGVATPCDTPYSSHKPEANIMTIEDIVATIEHNAKPSNIKHIVISGGEPTMQTEPLGQLLQQLNEKGFHTTIETNATIFDNKIARHTSLFSMSPKLKTSNPTQEAVGKIDPEYGIKYTKNWEDRHERDRRNIEVIQKYINSCYQAIRNKDGVWVDTYEIPVREVHDFQLKFVVSTIDDIAEIENDFLAHLKGVKPEDVCLMPEGIHPEDLMEKSKWIIVECVKRGWRFTPRLHSLIWGTARGV